MTNVNKLCINKATGSHKLEQKKNKKILIK